MGCDYLDMKICLTCPQMIWPNYYFCINCAKKYGLVNDNGKNKKPTEWPDWARFLYNDEVKWRRHTRDIYEYVVSYEQLIDAGFQFSSDDFE